MHLFHALLSICFAATQLQMASAAPSPFTPSWITSPELQGGPGDSTTVDITARHVEYREPERAHDEITGARRDLSSGRMHHVYREQAIDNSAIDRRSFHPPKIAFETRDPAQDGPVATAGLGFFRTLDVKPVPNSVLPVIDKSSSFIVVDGYVFL